MAELIKKAYFKNAAGVTQAAKLYTTLAEVQGQGIDVNTMSDNLIPVEKRKFEGWVAYQGAVVTVTQGVSVPEWGTIEATRIQTSGGTQPTKFLYGTGAGNTKTYYYKSVYVKNIGTTNFSVHGNNISSPLVIKPGESVKAIREGVGVNNSLNNSLEITSKVGESIDMIAYQPEIKQTTQAYMKFGEIDDSQATSARIKRYNNLIPVEKRKFEGWSTYRGSTAVLTQGLSVPEWSTSEATRIQTSGGENSTKLYTDNIPVPPIGTKCALRCLVKNQGTEPMMIATNLGTSVRINIGEAKAVFVNATGNGLGAFQFLCTTTNIGDSLDIIVYKPEMYLTSDLDETWAIISQAEIPYGQVVYTTPGTYTFTVPSGVTKVRLSMCGGGASGSANKLGTNGDDTYFGDIKAIGGKSAVIGKYGPVEGGIGGGINYYEGSSIPKIFTTITGNIGNSPGSNAIPVGFGCGGGSGGYAMQAGGYGYPPFFAIGGAGGSFGANGERGSVAGYLGAGSSPGSGWGGSGQYLVGKTIELATKTVSIMVGKGGVNTSNTSTYFGGSGNPGLVLIEWGGDIK